MGRYINNKKNKLFTMVNLIKLLMISFMAMILSVSTFAVEQQTHLVWYPFESASTSTIFDMSGNNINGVLVNGAVPQTTNLIWGARNLFCDGTNDYAISTLFDLTPQYSVSLWVRPSSSATKDYWTTINDNINSTFELEYDGVNSILELRYYNDSGVYNHKIIDNSIFATNTWYNVIVTIDADTDRFSYYKNGNAIIINGVFSDGYSFNENLPYDIHLCIDRTFNTSKIYGGKLDEYRIFNFELNPTQVTELFTSNTITFEQLNETPVIETPASLIQTNLINSTSIVFNESLNNKQVDLYVLLNNQSVSCEIYFDYELYDESTNLLSFKSTKEFEFGEHNYYVYCEKFENNVKYYDLTSVIPFEVVKGNKAVEFYFFNVNNENLLGEDYYFVTPCFESLSKYWNYEEPYYIKNIENGYTQFNLSYTAQHEFCLYRGNINYNSEIDGYTNEFDIVDIKNSIELGNIFVGQDTNSISLKLSTEDIYKPSEPEFWGKTWASLFSFVAGLLIGGALILLGMYAKNDKLMVVGGFIIMTGLGVSVWTFVGAIF